MKPELSTLFVFCLQVYLDFIDESFAKIQALRLVADAEGKKFST